MNKTKKTVFSPFPGLVHIEPEQPYSSGESCVYDRYVLIGAVTIGAVTTGLMAVLIYLHP